MSFALTNLDRTVESPLNYARGRDVSQLISFWRFLRDVIDIVVVAMIVMLDQEPVESTRKGNEAG